MDPHSQQQPQYEAPPAAPQGNMVPLTPHIETRPAQHTPEQAMLPSSNVAPANVPVSAVPPPITMPPLSPAPAAMQHPVNAVPVAPAVANDLDLIEKEWVEKAKAIVAQTRTDPHAQNSQMNVFKADYMKKRYGKDIKIEK